MKKARYILIVILFTFSLLEYGACEVSDAQLVELSSAAKILVGQLFSQNERERVNAAIRLARHNHPYVVNALMEMAQNDKSIMAQRVALKSLGEIGNEKALAIILNSILSEEISIKVEAMSAAVNFSTPSVKSALIRETDSKNPLIRQKAITFLGRIQKNNDDIILNILLEKLKDISEGVRVAAIKVLGEKSISNAGPYLAEVLQKDRSEVVRIHTAKALGKIDSQESEKTLKKALDDASPLVRITAAKGLAKFGKTTGMAAAIEGIKSPQSRVRVIACEIIGMVGSEKVEIFLKPALSDYDPRVRRAARKAMEKLKSRGKEPPLSGE